MMHKWGIVAFATGLLTVITAFCSFGCAEDQTQTLIGAAEQGKLETVKNLLSNGVDVNSKDKDGATPLIRASFEGHAEIVKVLLAGGADINAKQNHGTTALMWASFEGHADVVKALLDAGADINSEDDGGWTALMWASFDGKAEIVKALLAKGADVNAKDKNGLTALKMASRKGNTQVVELLKAHGAMETGPFTSLSSVLVIAGLLLIAFVLLLFSRIAKTRRMRLVFLWLGLAVWSFVWFWFLTPESGPAFGILFAGFLFISSAISNLVALPILRRRVIPPCDRVKKPIQSVIGVIIAAFLCIAFIAFFPAAGDLHSSVFIVGYGLLIASMIIFFVFQFQRIKICGNGVWWYNGLRPWEEYESFSWKGKTKESFELWLVQKSGVPPRNRLLVAPEDHEAVHQLLAANLPDLSKQR